MPDFVNKIFKVIAKKPFGSLFVDMV